MNTIVSLTKRIEIDYGKSSNGVRPNQSLKLRLDLVRYGLVPLNECLNGYIEFFKATSQTTS